MVRGIQVDHWQSCLHWPFLQSVFTLDYYFTGEFSGLPVSKLVFTGVIMLLMIYQHWSSQKSVFTTCVYFTGEILD